MATSERRPPASSATVSVFRVTAWIGFVGAVLLVFLGQHLLTNGSSLARALAVWCAGLTLFVLLDRGTAPDCAAGPAVASPVRRPRAQGDLLVLALVCALYVWFQARGRAETDRFTDVTIAWLLSMAAAVLAASRPSARWIDIARAAVRRRALRRPGPETLAIFGIAIAALVLRTVELDRYPTIVNQDGAALAMVAVQVMEGALTNPLTTAWYDNPTLFAYLQAASMWLFGDSLAGVRMLSALFGAGTVVLTWLFARRLFPAWVALAAACLLAFFQFHLHFSRTETNFVADPFFLMLMVFCLDRAFVERRRIDALVAGLAIGIAQYFYFSSRLLPAIALAYVLILVVRRRGRRPVVEAPRETAGLAAWVVAGALLAYLPLFAHYVDQPEDFNSRFNQVSVLRDGWLEEQQSITGWSAPETIARQFQKAVLLPFQTTQLVHHYHPDPPFVGLPMAILVALGLAVATVRVFDRRYAAVAVAWWAAVGGVGLTQDVEVQRFTVAAPLVTLLCAIALHSGWRIATLRLGLSRRVANAAVVAAVVLVSGWNVHFHFRESNQLDVYGFSNELISTRLAYELRDRDIDTFYFGGSPRMSYAGFPTFPFLARDTRGVDLDQPRRSPSDVPAPDGRTLFAFVPERAGELEFVRARFPGGQAREARARTGEMLYVSYEVSPDRGSRTE